MDETEITKQSYDKIAKDYAEDTFNWPIKDLRKKFLKYVKTGKILDIGCGPGRDVKYFMEHGFVVVGVDYSDGMIREAKRRVPKGVFKKIDMRKLNFPDNSFSGVWSCSSILHIPKSEAVKVIQEFRRVLKENGVLLVSTKKGEGEVISYEDHNVPNLWRLMKKKS